MPRTKLNVEARLTFTSKIKKNIFIFISVYKTAPRRKK